MADPCAECRSDPHAPWCRAGCKPPLARLAELAEHAAARITQCRRDEAKGVAVLEAVAERRAWQAALAILGEPGPPRDDADLRERAEGAALAREVRALTDARRVATNAARRGRDDGDAG